VDVVKGRQRGLWGLFEGTVTVSWAYPLEDAERRVRVEQDVRQLRETLPAMVDRFRVGQEQLAGAAVQSASVGAAGSDAAQNEWRALFAEALRAANRAAN
jgi:hypothetical protein